MNFIKNGIVRKIGAALTCAAFLLGVTGCHTAPSSHTAAKGKVRVAVSFDAMKELTEAVGGSRVSIVTVIPDGTEPHDFEPRPRDLTNIRSAAVFVYNGLHMESWADRVASAAGTSGLVRVDASQGAMPIGGDTAGSQPDPHLWLSLKGAELETRNIRDGLIKADPAGAAQYRRNCADFVARLEKLYTQYNGKFQAAPRKDFVTGHAAFGYLCRDFGLKQESVEDVFAEGEPSVRQLQTLITYCRRHHVHTIFAEDMVSPAISQTLASSVGAKVVKIYTIESSESGKSYLQRMEANLKAIDASLQ